jgi:phosphatidylglycerol---prolipoprotein diacylglyceryl transferase
MLTFPQVSPIAFSIAGFSVYWYGIAYMISIYFGAKQCVYYAHRYNPNLIKGEDSLNYVILGIIIGGRLGHIFFYDLDYFLAFPLETFKLWKGGMAFHGGLIGVLVGLYLFSKKIKQPFLSITDLAATAAPLAGIFIRAANFINAELYGRPTSLPWGMIFPHSDGLARHPSQLYEMFFEGFVLYFLTNISYIKNHKQTGFTTGVGLLFYGLFRFIIEFMREPEGMIWIFTKGQTLSLPLILVGGLLILFKKKK